MSVQNKIDSELNLLVDNISKIALSIERKGVHSSGELSKYADEIDSIVVTNNTVGDDAKKLDTEYLKKVGLLPKSFSGTPTERDLIVNRFIIQDPKNNLKFYSTSILSNISIELEGNKITDYQSTTVPSTENIPAIDKNKYIITNDGYYINEFSFNEAGTYKVSFISDTLSFKASINYDPNILSSMDDFLVYGANLKSHKHICYDSNKVESLYGIRPQNLDIVSSKIFNSVSGNLDAMGDNTELLGYVYNLRTGKAYLVDVVWRSDDYANIPSDFHSRLSTVIYNNMIEVITGSYSFALSVHGKSVESFISDIDYKEGDTLVFAFYKFRDDERSHKYSTVAVANYLGSLASAISSEVVEG